MFTMISPANQGKLWKHQREALDFAILHLNTVDTPCLIRMPTGTGKTGVIACLTMLSNQGTSLVLTPWAHLRNQMIVDLRGGFWGKVNITPNAHRVEQMLPSTAVDILKVTEQKVIVTTFTTLNDLRLNHATEYDALIKAVSLVVVDEGHYEPAVEWGKSVKGLQSKTVLLTATPYRNDLKLFRIGDAAQSTHHFTHAQAVDRAIIRKLQCEALNSSTDIPSLAKEFAKEWKEAKRKKELPSLSPRAIVCCANHQDIESAVAVLRSEGFEAIGIHEQFATSADKNLLQNVPDVNIEKAEIWIHQHKLTEGLDDHRFCCIALFTRIRNDRKLIQQIGRILRRNKDDRDLPALLYAPREFSAVSEWEAYLEFEPQLKLLDPEHFREVVNTLLGAQPAVEYFEGRFRRRFHPGELAKDPQVILSPSVLVREAKSDFSLEEYIEDCTDTLNTEDAVILGPDINAPCVRSANSALWVYASVRNSRFLQNTSLYEIKLETHCVVVAGGLVFIMDSRGNLPVEYIEERTTSLFADQLARYLSREFRPTHVSVDSSIPYDTVLRGADLRGHNLLNIPESLTDRVQICRTARGSSTTSGRRYVGMNNGRLRKEISEEELRTFDFAKFVAWSQSVALILKSKVDGSVLFRRYMPTCPPPVNPIPRTISLDLLRLDLSLTLADGTECNFKSSSCDIQVSVKDNRNVHICHFELDGIGITNSSVSLRVEYHPSKRRFWFNKEGGAAVRVTIQDADEPSSKSLVDFLNQKQDIILIGLDGGEIVYQGRNFYKIDYSYAEQALIGLISRPSNAPVCSSEKGSTTEVALIKQSKGTTFPSGSLFGAVAEGLIELPFNDEFLICDDLGTECADFVAANFQNCQLALIHAKTGSGLKVSASAFHDVVAQAMKNLVYLTRNAEIPKGVENWSKKSKWNKTGISRLYRAPKSAPVGKGLWNKLKSDIIGGSNPQLFVVLVTSGCCDVQELRTAISDKQKRTPEIAQLLHLLDGLNGYARQLGVRLLVRDLPYA